MRTIYFKLDLYLCSHQCYGHYRVQSLCGEYKWRLDVEYHAGKEDCAEPCLPDSDPDAEAEEGEDDCEEGRRKYYGEGVSQGQEDQASVDSRKIYFTFTDLN